MLKLDCIKNNIEIEDNVIIRYGELPGSEKLTIALKSLSKHITITNVGHRKVINLHLTRQNRKGRPNYLLELSYFTLGRIFIQLTADLERYFLKNQPIKILTVPINSNEYYYLEFENYNEDNSDIVIFNQKEKRIATRSNINIAAIEKLFLKQDDLSKSKSNSFMVYKIINKDPVTLGCITKYREYEGKQYYSFLSIEEYEKLNHHIRTQTLQILFKYNFKYKNTLQRILRVQKN